jgi:hypothetical protein
MLPTSHFPAQQHLFQLLLLLFIQRGCIDEQGMLSWPVAHLSYILHLVPCPPWIEQLKTSLQAWAVGSRAGVLCAAGVACCLEG